MGISAMHVIPMIITCMLQGTLCDTGIPRTFYGGNICSVATFLRLKSNTTIPRDFLFLFFFILTTIEGDTLVLASYLPNIFIYTGFH